MMFAAGVIRALRVKKLLQNVAGQAVATTSQQIVSKENLRKTEKRRKKEKKKEKEKDEKVSTIMTLNI